MRAIQQREFGGPEVLELVDLPIPEPSGGDEVLIRVARAGINFADTHKREDGYVQKQSLPLTPGSEVAGARADTGERVVALVEQGGYAEYALAPADRVFPIPDGLDDGAALALLIQGLTAWHLYRTCARIAPGDSVLVVSGAGGVGSLAVQLAKPMGAGRVVATASSDEKRELCLRLGADAATDGDPSDPELLRDRLLGANDGREYDVVLEMAGGPLFDVALRALADMGRMVVYGISSREQNEVRTGRLLKRSQSVIGFWLFHYLEQRRHLERPLAELFALAAAGEVTAVVGDTYALSDARRAQEDLVSRRTRGKLLLDPSR
ncbi:MAG TPA: NADPH:quinone oxidoreductase family protein [Baekduia sp.]|uniref:quinone oxidoreductase family protein n=1 Tax=Baekduia sp. TaxID=2600305 RepID=UPI002D76F823|nr:NADPH:quinone oxidoreductase family protein [Baekduia sp.]HET6510458.1 NADPH:quinone oxidoreductase family protein [Baekduia sp.]